MGKKKDKKADKVQPSPEEKLNQAHSQAKKDDARMTNFMQNLRDSVMNEFGVDCEYFLGISFTSEIDKGTAILNQSLLGHFNKFTGTLKSEIQKKLSSE